MVQQTQLSAMATPGRVLSFSAKTEAAVAALDSVAWTVKGPQTASYTVQGPPAAGHIVKEGEQ